MSITTDTRFESFEKLDRKTICNLIINTLKEHREDGLTAREIAVELYNKGLLRSNERQQTQPRLTELVDDGALVVVGKKFDELTQRKVAVYTIK